jgi:hypothetical protein
VRDALTLFGFSGKDAGDGLFIDVFFGCLCEVAGELLITDGLGIRSVKSAWICCGGRASMIS